MVDQIQPGKSQLMRTAISKIRTPHYYKHTDHYKTLMNILFDKNVSQQIKNELLESYVKTRSVYVNNLKLLIKNPKSCLKIGEKLLTTNTFRYINFEHTDFNPITQYLPLASLSTFKDFNKHVNENNLLIFPLPFERVLLNYLSVDSSITTDDIFHGVRSNNHEFNYYVTSRNNEFNHSSNPKHSLFG